MTDIFFVCDGSHEFGLGHVYQSMAVAESIASNGVQIRFSVPSRFAEALDLLHDSGFDTILWDDFQDNSCSFEPDCVVFDLPRPSESVLNAVSEARTVIYGNPRTNIPTQVCQAADFIVTPLSLEAGFSGVKRSVHGATQFVGPSHLILRSEFADYADRYSTTSLQNILLTFGGSDPSNLTSKLLQEVHIDGNLSIHVIIGAAFSHMDVLSSVLDEKNFSTITVHENINNMASLMFEGDLVVTSPGQTMFEAIFIGVPTLGISQNDEHRLLYENVEFVYQEEEIQNPKSLFESIYKQGPIGSGDIGTNKNAVHNAILHGKS